MKHTLNWHVWVVLRTVEFTYVLKNNEIQRNPVSKKIMKWSQVRVQSSKKKSAVSLKSIDGSSTAGVNIRVGQMGAFYICFWKTSQSARLLLVTRFSLVWDLHWASPKLFIFSTPEVL